MISDVVVANLVRLVRSTLPVLSLCALLSSACFAAPAPKDTKPRIIVLTDIGNEPDDSESMVRFLLYSNEFDVEGLLAVTSTWLRTSVHPEMIEERVRAYGRVLPNLKKQAAGYPDMEALLALIKAGRPEYGMSGVGPGKDTDASRRIIAVVDRPDPRLVWLTLWGGSTDLAQALHFVKETRSADAVAAFVAKLRIYSISDQDDAASWIRATFPTVFWIVSNHAFGEYSLAAWPGISSPTPGADFEMVSPRWLDVNIRRGPLGALYPLPLHIMEGDTPSFLYLIPNGLGSPEHPDWGSWGGRYGRIGPHLGTWSDVRDRAIGVDGQEYSGNQVTVWRWRREFQNDFAARIAWTVTANSGQANHPPVVIVNGSGGRAPISVQGCINQTVEISAAGTHDPDGNDLTYHWWQYREATMTLLTPQLTITGADSPRVRVVAPAISSPFPNVEVPEETIYHIVLSVTDKGSPPLTRYRRILLTVPSQCLNSQSK